MSCLPNINDSELTDFFNWRPARLYSTATASQLKSSRESSFYDKLLAENLILRRVRSLPSLPEDVAGTVDEALKTISDRNVNLPPLSKGFPTQSIRSIVERARSPAMQNEYSVAEFYGHTTALFCAAVASTLALQPDLPSLPEWLNVLHWSFSPTKSGYAIADRSLQILSEKIASPDDVRSEAEKILYESGLGFQLQRIRKIVGDLAVWEFKGFTVGDHPAMLGIRNEAFTGIPFRWETMGDVERGTQHRQYTTSPIGPDAEQTPWTLPGDAFTGTQANDTQPANTQGAGTQAVQLSDILYSSSPLTELTDDDFEAPEPGESSTRTESSGKRGRGVVAQHSGSRPNKKQKRDDDDENSKSEQELTAASFIQQAWARAVRHDATLIIIQSGNSEYVCVRHRATQTLYVSNLIDIPNCENPRHAKLHTGIYITALRDAMQRVRNMTNIEIVGQPSNIGDASEDGGNDAGEDRRDRKQGSGKGKEREPGSGPGFIQTNDGVRDDLKVDQVSRKDPDPCEDELVEQIIAECDKCEGLLMDFQYGIYNSPAPAAFIRVEAPMPTSPASPQRRRVFQADARLVLVITSEIGTGATGIVHGGILEVELPGRCASLDIVAKLAFSNYQKERLAHENAIYRYLSSRHITGIPTLLGLFVSVDGGPSALLMTYNGVPITSDTQPLPSNIREQFRMILQEIHNVGIVHGDIRRQNLLIDDRGRASIIDFDQAKKSSSAKAMEEEFLHLVGLLD